MDIPLSAVSSPIFPGSRKTLYDNLCIRLNIDKLTEEEAWNLLQKFFSLNKQPLGQENEQVWPLCALYVVSTSGNIQSGVQLSQLLRDGNTRLYDFFVPLKTFINVLELDIDIVERLQLKYVIVTILFEKYQEMCGRFFNMDLENITKNNNNLRRKSPSEQIFRFGWLLFLLAKEKVLWNNHCDFVQCLHLLLCCIDLLLVHVPENILKIPLNEILHLVDPTIKKPSETLFVLCHINHANYTQVKNLEERFQGWLKKICDNSTLHCQIMEYSDLILKYQFYLGGLLDTFLEVNTKAINNDYEVLLYEICDFDERLYLENHQQLQSPMRPPTTNKTNIPMTPAKAALSVDNWLIKTLVSREEGPGPNLTQFYTENTELIIPNLINNFMNLFNFQAENIERKLLVTKLFYKLLEEILMSEFERLKSKEKLENLLSHEVFNKSLLGCSLEVVICSYRESQLKFPWILEKFQISAYEFYTIIEFVIKNEPEFPRVVKKHLINIEERILEELVWKANSPVFNGLNEEQRKLLRDRLEKNVGTPKKIEKNACTEFSSPITENSNKGIHKKLEVLLRKVAHLASLRIQELSQELIKEGAKIRSTIIQQIEYVFMHVMTQTPLIQNRHMDQLMMCIVYGVCKVNRIPGITFKLIVEKYLVQPQAISQTYRRVLLADNTYGDIIQFYNEVFLSSMESILLSLSVVEKITEQNKENEVDIFNNNNTSSLFVPPSAKSLKVSSPLLYKSPRPKMSTILISPRRTPLLLRDKRDSLCFGTTPQSHLEKINHVVNKKTKAKRKLDYGVLTELTTPKKEIRGEEIEEDKSMGTIPFKRKLEEDSDETNFNKKPKI